MDGNYDELLTNSKRTIKKWELEFEKVQGRRPAKEDLKVAPSPVTEAYKIYYKIKKKQDQLSATSSPPSNKVDADDQRPKENRPEPVNGEVTGPPAKQSLVGQADGEAATPVAAASPVWGAHLNKKKAVARTSSAGAGGTSSPVLSYSKLTEKLRKGAKINIRSSLTSRKRSTAAGASCESNERTSDLLDASVGSVFDSPGAAAIDDRLGSDRLPTGDDRAGETTIAGIKPKIVQGDSKALYRGRAASLAAGESASRRHVDLQWLDQCLAEDSLNSVAKAAPQPTPSSPKADDKDDIIYSSDEEVRSPKGRAAKAPPPPLQPSSASLAPVVAVKRKLDADAGEAAAEEAAPPERPRAAKKARKDAGVEKRNDVDAEKQQRLESKMASGTANENFIRINLKKKVFVRGKKTLTGGQHKRNQWKARQAGTNGGVSFHKGKNGKWSRTFSCKRCGEIGHVAKNCIGDKLMALDVAAEVDGVETEPLQFPTLQEAVDLAAEGAATKGRSRGGLKGSTTNDEEEKGDFQLVDLDAIKVVEPLFTPEELEGSERAPASVYEMLRRFGHETFRPGQEAAVVRVLSGRSTLVVQSTGAGKSLCYQLPAALYAQRAPCVTVVVSPLVSLMEDQVSGLPSFVKAACLHTNQSESVRQKVVASLASGKTSILLISPEAVVSGGPYGLAALLRQLPPVAFVCIDEAHCVSQWSHNFRPSYLRICKVLRTKMKIKTVLGLTATAPRSTLASIAEHLGVTGLDEGGVIRGCLLPPNLHLSVSRDADRDRALLYLLAGERFQNFDSIIVYCIRREECERIATLLRTHSKDPARDMAHAKSNRRGISWSAEAYHAGLTGARRAAIQKQFMGGKLRIVVATVAFGMGINKADIRAIIHYNAPRNFESYVQEIGRAGRDGLPAHCHVYLNSEGKDLQELRRFIYANSLDRHVLSKLLRKIVPQRCSCQQGRCSGHEVAVPIESTVAELDLPEENISTLLCHLESHPAKWVLEMGTPVYATAKVSCYGGVQQLKASARQCPPLGAALAVQNQNGGAQVTFAVVEAASRVNWDSGAAKRQLKELEWDTSGVALGGKARRSGVLVEFSDLAFHLKMRADLSESEQDEALEYLHERCVHRERSELQQLRRIHQALLSVSYAQSSACCDRVEEERSAKLRRFIHDYFDEVDASEPPDESAPMADEALVRSDIRSLILNYRDQTFTGRAIARVLHGIASPCFPAEVWGRARRHWRAHLDKDFNQLCRMAVQELLALK